MTDVNTYDRKERARYAHPILGKIDALGYLEVAGPIPAEEMGLHSRQRVQLVGTLYDPATVGDEGTRNGASPRYIARPTTHSFPSGDAGKPNRHVAYQDRITVRIAPKNRPTRVRYNFHEPDLAGQTVAVVTDVVRPRMVFLIPFCLALIASIALSGLINNWHDPNARRGYYDGKTPDEVRADLDAEVDWWSMEISVASYMEVRENETSLEARIENVEANHCDQRVRIYPTANPSDVLFESGAIAPGEYLQTVELAHPLPLGNNEITVEFQGYEQGISLVSDEGLVFGHNTFGASCAAEVTVYCQPSGVA